MVHFPARYVGLAEVYVVSHLQTVFLSERVGKSKCIKEVKSGCRNSYFTWRIIPFSKLSVTPILEGVPQAYFLDSLTIPWEPTTFIFRGYNGYNPYIGGLKASFFHGFFWGPKVVSYLITYLQVSHQTPTFSQPRSRPSFWHQIDRGDENEVQASGSPPKFSRCSLGARKFG